MVQRAWDRADRPTLHSSDIEIALRGLTENIVGQPDSLGGRVGAMLETCSAASRRRSWRHGMVAEGSIQIIAVVQELATPQST